MYHPIRAFPVPYSQLQFSVLCAFTPVFASGAYEALLLQILTTMSKPPIVLSICGQGSPNEVRTDPDNNRCRPCSHVERASVEFNSKYSGRFDTNYIFVPCNGSIVTGVDDIGCNGHKNQIGQARVSAFLEPKIRKLMKWY